MKNLYELTNDFIKLQQLIEDGEFSLEDLADTMEMINEDIEQKAENYGLIMTNLQTMIDGIEKETQRLNDYKKSLTTGIEGLKTNLANSMLAINKTKFKTEHFQFSFRKSETVEILDQSLIPADYINVKTTETANKTEIKKALKNGCIIEGVILKENQNLQIK